MYLFLQITCSKDAFTVNNVLSLPMHSSLTSFHKFMLIHSKAILPTHTLYYTAYGVTVKNHNYQGFNIEITTQN